MPLWGSGRGEGTRVGPWGQEGPRQFARIPLREVTLPASVAWWDVWSGGLRTPGFLTRGSLRKGRGPHPAVGDPGAEWETGKAYTLPSGASPGFPTPPALGRVISPYHAHTFQRFRNYCLGALKERRYFLEL